MTVTPSMPPSPLASPASATTGLSLSVVIPVLDEAKHLPATLACVAREPEVEIIVADGGSTDGSADVAAAHGATVVTSSPGRGPQLGAGADAARGDAILFLHADTRLPTGYAGIVAATLARPGVVAGAFRLAIDSPRLGLRWIERTVNVRSRWFGRPYGDQAPFLRATELRAVGGVPDLPIMEDYELMRRLRRRGRITIADAAVTTSARRWERDGILRTTLRHQAMIIAYHLGTSPARLQRWRGDRR